MFIVLTVFPAQIMFTYCVYWSKSHIFWVHSFLLLALGLSILLLSVYVYVVFMHDYMHVHMFVGMRVCVYMYVEVGSQHQICSWITVLFTDWLVLFTYLLIVLQLQLSQLVSLPWGIPPSTPECRDYRWATNYAQQFICEYRRSELQSWSPKTKALPTAASLGVLSFTVSSMMRTLHTSSNLISIFPMSSTFPHFSLKSSSHLICPSPSMSSNLSALVFFLHLTIP